MRTLHEMHAVSRTGAQEAPSDGCATRSSEVKHMFQHYRTLRPSTATLKNAVVVQDTLAETDEQVLAPTHEDEVRRPHNSHALG